MSRAWPKLAALVVMGVSGTGKSTLARALAERTGWPFVEGDDLHPPANIAKMRGGVPLTDADRAPWLVAIAHQIAAWREADLTGVITCSALKRAYRDPLAGGQPDVCFVYLHGDTGLLAQRMAERRGHFMPPALLSSQLATLEPPDPTREPVIAVDFDDPLQAQCDTVLAALAVVETR